MEKLIITVAPTGAQTTRKHTPYVPFTPKEIADSVYEAWQAGASIAHIHVRDEGGNNSLDLGTYIEVVNRIKDKCDIIINLTTAGGVAMNDEDRLRVCELGSELATFDAGSMNFGSEVFLNSPNFLERLAKKMKEYEIKPEIEIFDVGMIDNTLRIAKKGFIESPFHFQFVLGIRGGMPATPKNLLFLAESIPAGSTWSAIGASKDQLAINTMSIIMGGHVRVGMEDSVYYRQGELAKTNAQFVERIVDLSKTLGRDVATPNQAREILGLDNSKHLKGLSSIGK
ncbi:3-keto-5-aminohexanoate cleavage protein [Priestia megaterium]|uniref:3-keto-5-aminohexanoate cleavage protein n=1 Tax=Priestia megaterium TaxID=1404 RepID=A0AAE5P4T4_PRIMG|nr:3-keto-5-aminohexanoate cleavage protein [Priestia megaterium]MDR4222663.1 3-keto-5-aminohexanoate cleavage protein [Priestia megaterium]MDR7207467.1 3-keto-5-aminohexanoate cleavage enzyme [Priestia megaterium]MED4234835.1 3-keto-5-aminohexanoate cleavage protein [Priestia megaterium]PES34382.1 3-keto-5-aminohexanoate cleavage protein [Priestia megaterium]PFE33552.1 3-keto-5-aminohexanoate cleavage protein [Priestia megaterium]